MLKKPKNVKPRKCSRFYCDQMRDRLCCRDCVRAYRCNNRCLNDPKRCRLVDAERQGEKPKAVSR